ncbi:tRNA 2-selenouridine(34) synthase MnmH [Halopseudomonas nanhaiensis]|uniref:tRNA 2-selenouridine(34) synthase MnmH n=1 Tax=Halopseudomonas nanhaiensis TaxID=2830842 RepID=UPI001CC02CC0|nr:tRNA 2-selenouridine(34) synthase MnmH [Halopseudomonas nanhaiensis]UAW99704.1 tRNA 2-selenouridine(34) synthase MnmH [Halopseudomonas nanhaiensis]
MRGNTEDFRQLFLSGTPLMDVRAPIEFAKGAFPNAQNRPLMNDGERQKVGICYKEQGQQAAIDLGNTLVRGKIKQQRIDQWRAFAEANPNGYLYCFRGGLRSQIVQQWLAEAGVEYPRVVGGYKAMRRFLIDTLDHAVAECPLTLVAGLTGTGKTEVIAALDHSLDLEGHAHHRGSSFGRHATPQPGQIDFENRLAIEALHVLEAGHRSLVLEDEGRIVGSCSVPVELFRTMQAAPLVWLDDSFDNRVSRILGDYVIDMQAEFDELYPEEPDRAFAALSEHLLGSLLRIRKRLGGERHQQLEALMQAALDVHQRTGDEQEHRAWIAALLEHYYDPMYAYQRSGKEERVVFSGTQDEVIDYLRAQRPAQSGPGV